jgi:hypothetical protein
MIQSNAFEQHFLMVSLVFPFHFWENLLSKTSVPNELKLRFGCSGLGEATKTAWVGI